MIPLTPESWGSESDRLLREFNTCHDESGRFCSGKGSRSPGNDKLRVAKGHPADDPGLAAAGFNRTLDNPPSSGPVKDRKEKIQYMPSVTDKGVIKARTVEEAVEHILAGRDVELAKPRHINTVLSKLAEMANDAKAKGENAPNYDLCKVSVAGTNVFCTKGVRTKQYPNGVPRIEMPQLGGFPVPGSAADKLPRTSEGGVDGTEPFIAHLKSMGIKVTARKAAAASLKASQNELVGPKVAGMMQAKGYDPGKSPIFTSRDDYVIDGHHRWAAVVGRDAADGRLGGSKMNTYRVDAPISRILRIANTWAAQFGIQAAAGPNSKPKSNDRAGAPAGKLRVDHSPATNRGRVA